MNKTAMLIFFREAEIVVSYLHKKYLVLTDILVKCWGTDPTFKCLLSSAHFQKQN